MFYKSGEKVENIGADEISGDAFVTGYFTSVEFEKLCKSGAELPFPSVGFEDNNFRTKIDVFDDYSLCTVRVISPDIDICSETLLAFIIAKNLFIVISIRDAEHKSKTLFDEAVERFSEKEVTAEKFVFAFLDSIISEDGRILENTEYEIGKLEDKVLRDYDCKNFNEQLMLYKKKLLILRNFYEQLADIGHELQENENEIFDSENLRCFGIFTDRAERLCSNVKLLRESLVQLREVYQANSDLRLNNTMKLFTVITTLFSPLSFIVGWYGMNFDNMPELKWKYGYLCVIIVCAAAVAFYVYIFKKKKLL